MKEEQSPSTHPSTHVLSPELTPGQQGSMLQWKESWRGSGDPGLGHCFSVSPWARHFPSRSLRL